MNRVEFNEVKRKLGIFESFNNLSLTSMEGLLFEFQSHTHAHTLYPLITSLKQWGLFICLLW